MTVTMHPTLFDAPLIEQPTTGNPVADYVRTCSCLDRVEQPDPYCPIHGRPRPTTITATSATNVFAPPLLESPAPVAPGSESSRLAAKAIEPFRAKSYRTVMLALLSADKPLTREELSARTGIKESSLCARINELRPLWIERHDMGGVASSGMRVDTYSLTTLGVNRFRGEP